MEAVWISCAFLFGLFAKRAGLPPLVGYLGAGFAIAQLATPLGLPSQHSAILDHLAHTGVLLLLFTVGLKLKASQIFKSEVLVSCLAHMFFSTLLFAPIIHFGFGAHWLMSLTVAAALYFSSTVLAVKVLESRQETRALHGRIAIAILIVQDILAMGLLSATSGDLPSIYALGLFILPFTRPLFHKLLDHSGHDEMLLLCGLGLAIIAGAGFVQLGLSSELGALIMGAMCAKHEKAGELYQKLWALKEVFLVAFFLTIGLKGMPTFSDVTFALTMVALLPLQGAVFFIFLTVLKLKSRSSFLTASALTNFSEFGLIVAASAAPEWMIPIALSVAFSFVLSAPLNRFAHPLYDRFEPWLSRFERSSNSTPSQPVSLGDTKLLIVGMGRVGRAAYKAGKPHYLENELMGIDSDNEKIKSLSKDKYRAAYGDAEHANFWKALDTSLLRVVILSMDCPDAALITTTALRKSGFKGRIVAHSEYADQAEILTAAGADRSYITLDEAGIGLIAHALEVEKAA